MFDESYEYSVLESKIEKLTRRIILLESMVLKHREGIRALNGETSKPVWMEE